MDLVIMYHYVMKPEEFKGSVPISLEKFREQIIYGKENYQVTIPSVVSSEQNNFLITFDDATKDQYTNAYRILKEDV